MSKDHERKMARPTGHQTITHEDNMRSKGRAFRAAREGDTYVDASGKHWLCQGDFVKPSVYDEGNRAEIHRDSVAPCGNDWKAERGVPAGVDVKFRGSYTEKVIKQLLLSHSYSRALRDAIELLQQYHRDLHVPYKQRDEARKEREEIKALIRGFVDGISDECSVVTT